MKSSSVGVEPQLPLSKIAFRKRPALPGIAMWIVTTVLRRERLG